MSMKSAVVGNYKLKKVLGSGSYGEVYEGVDLVNDISVAVKLEGPNTRPHLHDEAKMITVLGQNTKDITKHGVPDLHWFGQYKEYNVMVIDLMGPTLEDMLNAHNRKLDLKTVLMIADQTIGTLEFIHKNHVIHRDVKPANLVVGRSESRHQVFFIDYGLAKFYIDPKTHKHIPYKEGKSLTGTARYASVNTHLGYEQSRRDDLESLGYNFVYLLTGSLPWQGMQKPKAETKKEKYQKIQDCKRNTSVRSLCQGLPAEFATYIQYTRDLQFDEEPDYVYLKKLMRNLYRRKGYEYDCKFVWSEDSTSDSSYSNYEYGSDEYATASDY